MLRTSPSPSPPPQRAFARHEFQVSTAGNGGGLPLWRRMTGGSSSTRHSYVRPLALVALGVLLSHVLSWARSWATTPSLPPFYVPPERYWPLQPLTPNPAYPPTPPDSVSAIPSIVHYVYGYKDPTPGTPANQAGELLPYYAYLAIRSALVNLQPDAIHFHYKHEPRGPFWELLKPSLTLLKTPAPEEIFGRKLTHFAHKSDVIRLQALRATGGIYLDIDVYVVRPMTPLLPFHTVLAHEASPNSKRPPLDPEGLCNAVILSRPGARFLDRWLMEYERFDEASWAEFSVRKPWEIARRPEAKGEVTVLGERAFFWPLWEGSGEESRIRYVHEDKEHDFLASGQFTYHAWESLAAKYLDALTPASVRKSESSFGRLVKRYVTKDDDEAYKIWRATKDREAKAAAA